MKLPCCNQRTCWNKAKMKKMYLFLVEDNSDHKKVKDVKDNIVATIDK